MEHPSISSPRKYGYRSGPTRCVGCAAILLSLCFVALGAGIGAYGTSVDKWAFVAVFCGVGMLGTLAGIGLFRDAGRLGTFVNSHNITIVRSSLLGTRARVVPLNTILGIEETAVGVKIRTTVGNYTILDEEFSSIREMKDFIENLNTIVVRKEC